MRPGSPKVTTGGRVARGGMRACAARVAAAGRCSPRPDLRPDDRTGKSPVRWRRALQVSCGADRCDGRRPERLTGQPGAPRRASCGVSPRRTASGATGCPSDGPCTTASPCLDHGPLPLPLARSTHGCLLDVRNSFQGRRRRLYPNRRRPQRCRPRKCPDAHAPGHSGCSAAATALRADDRTRSSDVQLLSTTVRPHDARIRAHSHRLPACSCAPALTSRGRSERECAPMCRIRPLCRRRRASATGGWWGFTRIQRTATPTLLIPEAAAPDGRREHHA